MGEKEMKLVFLLAIALVASASELQELNNQDVDPVLDNAKEASTAAEEADEPDDVGESTGFGFGGALLTSGSFTMMAASGGLEEEEEELGEGTGFGFGGALLTSGSFTMMAASGGLEE